MKRGDMVVLSKKALARRTRVRELKTGVVLCIWEDLTSPAALDRYSGSWVKVMWNGGHIYKHPRWYVKGVKNESR